MSDHYADNDTNCTVDDEDRADERAISRRRFIQDVVTISAAGGIVGFPSSARASRDGGYLEACLQEQLTLVLDRLSPAEGAIPAAGHLGIARFIDAALAVAPYLGRSIAALLARLPDAEAFGDLPLSTAERILERLEEQEPLSFNLLRQAAYTGYYSHPEVQRALEWVDPLDAGYQHPSFDAQLVDHLTDPAQRRRDLA